MDYDKIDFVSAVQLLADRVGVEVTFEHMMSLHERRGGVLGRPDSKSGRSHGVLLQPTPAPVKPRRVGACDAILVHRAFWSADPEIALDLLFAGLDVSDVRGDGSDRKRLLAQRLLHCGLVI